MPRTKTAVKKQVKPVPQTVRDETSLMPVLKAIGKLRIDKSGNYDFLHPLLDEALNHIQSLPKKYYNEYMTMFFRNLFFTFSIQRNHDLWKEGGIKSDPIGSQEFASGRVIYQWLWERFSHWMEDLDNLRLFFEYSSWKLLTYNQLRTTKGGTYKSPSKVTSYENTLHNIPVLAECIAQEIRANRNLSLLAKWIPKRNTGAKRTTKKIVGKHIKLFKDLESFEYTTPTKEWVKVNGEPVEPGSKVSVKKGDVISYPRELRPETVKRRNLDNKLVDAICTAMGWDVTQYNKFRSTHLAQTPEHLFSSGKILKFTKDDFHQWVDKLSSGQQHVVYRTLCYKDIDTLKPRSDKWGNLPGWMIEWDKKEQAVAQEVREAMAEGDDEKVKELTRSSAKTKTAGKQTIDLLADLVSGRLSSSQVENQHTNLLARMNMEVPVFTIIDGSASMTQSIVAGWAVDKSAVDPKYTNLACIDIALALALTFMTTNPEPEFKESVMWFGSETHISGSSRFINTAPNPYLTHSRYNKVTKGRIVDLKKGFVHNFNSLKQANPGNVSHTNVGQTIQTFLGCLEDGLNPEQLPRVLLYLTDEEYNAGMPIKDALELANSQGWYPLVCFWGIRNTSRLDQYKGINNVLVVRGFSESVLTQVLRFINKGSVRMEDELWAINDMPGLEPIVYSI